MAPITLQPSTDYSLSAHMPDENTLVADLLFSKSSNYVTPNDWVMGSTSATNTFVTGEYLKLAVDATAVPEPATLAFAVLGSVVLAGRILKRRT